MIDTASKARVYVIDDDEDARDSMTALLRDATIETIAFASAEEFLRAYGGHRPACVVTDLRMDGMSGQDLLDELHRRGIAIPALVITAHADTPTTVQAIRSGAQTLLDKPCRESDLWEAVQRALDSDRQALADEARRADVRRRLDSLTPAETMVLDRVLAGDPNKVIASKLDIAVRTVEARRQSIYQKLKADSVAEIVQLVVLADPARAPYLAPPPALSEAAPAVTPRWR